MKNRFFLVSTMAVLLVSCNQKNKEATTANPHMIDNDSTMMHNDTTMMNNNTKMMDNNSKIYACPMHPGVQGKLNEKCPKCGMKLTAPVLNEEIKKTN